MTTPDRRPPARVRAWVGKGALGVLLVLTSLAVASVSAWLVIPYLALMAVILFTPSGQSEQGNDHGEGSEARSGPGVTNADDRPGSEVGDETLADTSADPATVVEPAEGPGPDSEPRGVKTRRGKGRGRKAKAVAESPGATATWIKIGPGKFVRVESPDPPVVAASPTSEGEPSGSFPPSSGTVAGPPGDPLPPDRDAESPIGDEVPSAPEGEPEAGTVPAPDESAGAAPDLWQVEGDLGPAPGPDLATGSTAANLVALESHVEPPPPEAEGVPVDSFAPLPGTGEGSPDADSPGVETEAVLSAEGSSPAGVPSEVWDRAVPDEPTAPGSAPMQAGGDPDPAMGPDHSAGSAGDAAPGSDPVASPLVDSESGSSESGSEVAAEPARDARDQALEEIAGVWVAAEFPAVDPGIDAASDRVPDGDLARDNGIAPDTFSLIPPAEIEDASTQDRGAVAGAPYALDDPPNRPTVGTLLASLRGLRPRVGPANATRSSPGATSPGRIVRSGRRARVSPILRRPAQRGPGRFRPPCRTFPPRSPPALAGRS